MSLNRVILIGRLGKDPELKVTPSGKQVCNFSVATSEKRGGEEQTEWHNIVCWEKTAELAGKYLKKGREVCVEGKIQSREYEKDGVKRRVYDILANNVTFIGGGNRDEDSSGSRPAASAAPPRSNPAPAPSSDGGWGDEEVPF